jgi:hypothetical protein
MSNLRDKITDKEVVNDIQERKQLDEIASIREKIVNAISSRIVVRQFLVLTDNYDKIVTYLPPMLYILNRDNAGKQILKELGIDKVLGLENGVKSGSKADE